MGFSTVLPQTSLLPKYNNGKPFATYEADNQQHVDLRYLSKSTHILTIVDF